MKFISTIVLSVILGFACPLSAEAGFLDDLFGSPTPAHFAPSFSRSSENTHQDRSAREARRAAVRAAKRAAERKALRAAQRRIAAKQIAAKDLPRKDAAAPGERKANCCATADEAISALMEDPTLRPGDVVAGHAEMLVVVRSASEGSGVKLAPVRSAKKLSATTRTRLVAYAPIESASSETERSRGDGKMRAVARGAGELVGPPMELRPLPQIEAQYVIDPTGKRVRFVGGHLPQ